MACAIRLRARSLLCHNAALPCGQMPDPQAIVAQLARLYDAAVATLRADIAAFVATGTPPPPDRRTARA